MSVTGVSNNTAAASQADQARVTLGDNLDDFLQLLLVQLKNQDPTDPLDTNAVTQQIATLSQVEQQINTNKNLESLLSAFLATQYNNAVSYIGKNIEAPGNAGSLKDGNGLFTYYLASNAQKAKITITDQTGNVVFEGPASTGVGRNQYVWDGKNAQGNPMPNGNYTFEITAEDSNGETVPSETVISGLVTSVDSINGKVYLSMNDLSVAIENVTSIQAAL